MEPLFIFFPYFAEHPADGFLDEVEKMESDPAQTRETFRSEDAFYYFPYNAGLSYVDYDRQKVDLSFPELEQGASIYKNLNQSSFLF